MRQRTPCLRECNRFRQRFSAELNDTVKKDRGALPSTRQAKSENNIQIRTCHAVMRNNREKRMEKAFFGAAGERRVFHEQS